MKYIYLLFFFCSVSGLKAQTLPKSISIAPSETEKASLESFASTLETEQKSIKPLRLGLRFGVPYIATFNVEYVTPLANHRIALTADFFTLSKGFDAGILNYSSFEIGTNVYFNNSGQGFYGSLTYFDFKSDFGFTAHTFTNAYNGNGKAEFQYQTVNVKIGVKLGRPLYFRAEAGYGFGNLPEYIVVNSVENNLSVKEEIPDIPGISSSGVILFNIGLGYSFL